jgi:hypothetical protein
VMTRLDSLDSTIVQMMSAGDFEFERDMFEMPLEGSPGDEPTSDRVSTASSTAYEMRH